MFNKTPETSAMKRLLPALLTVCISASAPAVSAAASGYSIVVSRATRSADG